MGVEVRYVHSEDLKPGVTKLKESMEKELSNKFKVELKDLEYDTKTYFDSEDLEKSNLETVF